MEHMLKIENLKYKDVLNNLSLYIEEKSLNVLIGPNGSGKSTLVKCIAGLLKYEGSIYIDNVLINKENIYEIRKNIGVMLENTFLEDKTVLYNITYPLLNLNYNPSDAEKEAHEIAKKLDIESLLQKNVKDLSLSKRKIVLFAQTLVHKPKLIIIDDTFDELDNNYRKKILDFLINTNSTVLFVTNNVEDILLFKKVIIINKGEIISHTDVKKAIKNEQLFIKNNIKLPFLVELSHKLKDYNLIDDVVLDTKEMVDAIWK